MGYWQAVRARARREAIKAAWGDGFGTAKAWGSPAVAAVVGFLMGGATQSIVTGLATAVIVLVLWPVLFFIAKMISVPAAMHSEMQVEIEAAQNLLQPVPLPVATGFLTLLSEKCGAFRENRSGPAREDQLVRLGQLIEDFGRIVGPDNVLMQSGRFERRREQVNVDSAVVDADLQKLRQHILNTRDRLTKDDIWQNDRTLAKYIERRKGELAAFSRP